jgi:hypothetical protein
LCKAAKDRLEALLLFHGRNFEQPVQGAEIEEAGEDENPADVGPDAVWIFENIIVDQITANQQHANHDSQNAIDVTHVFLHVFLQNVLSKTVTQKQNLLFPSEHALDGKPEQMNEGFSERHHRRRNQADDKKKSLCMISQRIGRRAKSLTRRDRDGCIYK